MVEKRQIGRLKDTNCHTKMVDTVWKELGVLKIENVWSRWRRLLSLIIDDSSVNGKRVQWGGDGPGLLDATEIDDNYQSVNRICVIYSRAKTRLRAVSSNVPVAHSRTFLKIANKNLSKICFEQHSYHLYLHLWKWRPPAVPSRQLWRRPWAICVKSSFQDLFRGCMGIIQVKK